MSTLRFTALDGSNPLAFLAALGAARLANLTWPERGIRLGWAREGAWRPELVGIDLDPAGFCQALMERAPWVPVNSYFAPLGNNLTVPRATFNEVAKSSVTNSLAAAFTVSFGSEIFEDKERISYTDLSFITGSGHQHFLGTARQLAESTTAEHLYEGLFGPWKNQDKGLSFRWDPEDAKEYALRWRNPSVGGVTTSWGANRLAFESLPLFPTQPGATLQTTGFRHARNQPHEFTWPIWAAPVSIDTIGSLLGLKQLVASSADFDRSELEKMGIHEVFRSQRVRIGQGANFKVSFRPARSI
jgi:hypothetical protein